MSFKIGPSKNKVIKPKKRKTVDLHVRLEKELHTMAVKSARGSHRTLNGELNHLLGLILRTRKMLDAI